MSSKNPYREEQHKALFNVYEVKAMEPVLTRLGLGFGELKRAEISHILECVYSLPLAGRDDTEKVLAGLQIGMQTLTTFLRYEIWLHSNNIEFRKRVLHAVNGNPYSSNSDEVRGLRGMLDLITSLIGETT